MICYFSVVPGYRTQGVKTGWARALPLNHNPSPLSHLYYNDSKKLDSNDNILYDVIYVTLLERQKYTN